VSEGWLVAGLFLCGVWHLVLWGLNCIEQLLWSATVDI